MQAAGNDVLIGDSLGLCFSHVFSCYDADFFAYLPDRIEC